MAHAAHDAHPAHDDDALAPHASVHVPGDDLPHHGVYLAEPKSPTWLPIVGLLLLATLLVWWLSTPSDAEDAAAAAAASASAASASASAAASQPTTDGAQPPQPQLTANNAPPRPPGAPGLPPGMKPAPGAAINPRFKKP